MSRAVLSPPVPTRLGVALFVTVLHIALVLALIRGFAPQFTAAVSERVTAVLTVDLAPPTPEPPPAASEPEPAGAAAETGRHAVPKEAAVREPRIAIASPLPAPPVAGRGDAAAAGAGDTGTGTGAGGQGSGTGSGAGGTGRGAGGASKAVKIAGDISSARDYPKKSRELRIGDRVVVALTVGTDGKVKFCRVHRASRDAEADRITCRLAIERFRFRPAADAQGNPVESIYGWQQRWYDPRQEKR